MACPRLVAGLVFFQSRSVEIGHDQALDCPRTTGTPTVLAKYNGIQTGKANQGLLPTIDLVPKVRMTGVDDGNQ